ncbi:leucyl aminopeptidase [Candidatus Uhrbacteria bacterium CG_4_10_14_0_2_um_filter_41_7]|uniref:Probable cytosol aminopeptidase n=1 Tax=Candidatus Uhrbacteria bacterium CG_4_9_14_3_um_filter_41_35 TaxID=1975034 RepID=A0A2M7XF90_9BACT|nr:MAG: leucyl aminopeptidase [Candidatus Uhrbacteria bacterium CG11_big_fil_rev_8_21_14_0_20_41_9]PIZ54446.1 MAG: leucyl aminopeptidase [Candidatus Uhrbacteria bacterium CG_4_10_14_0_2_um_filter_41_7]PJA46525.1 MAG: leucyl aminopeptidase [Candidatus Uhrbacteria bacterium CG_4_9_14_3_um_filter_41_35]
MEILVQKGDILEVATDLLVVGAYESELLHDPFTERLNELLGGKMTKMAKAQEFEAKLGQTLIFAAPDKMDMEYVMVVGLGELKSSVVEAARLASGTAVQMAKKMGLRKIAIEFFGEDHEEFSAKNTAEAMTEALLLADYQFNVYKKRKGVSIKEVIIVAEDGRDARSAEKGIEKGRICVDGTTVARDLVNTPGQDMTPTRLAEAAEEISRISGETVKVEIFDRAQVEKMGMGAYLAVAQGADSELKFIHLTYTPTVDYKKTVAVVGKGVTFDSGGLSLKPGSSMETMKCDMAGAATVLGLFTALGRLQPKVAVHGIIAACENMPSGRAIRPGDIVKSANGKTIEILNTDAEGRLTLADALHYAQKFEPDYLVDLATLTGAIVVGLGEEIAGVFSNDNVLSNKLVKAGEETGEDMCALPLHSAYKKLIQSEVADIQNTSTSRYGGSITAALFLSEFINSSQKWAHIDIAGPAFAERPMNSYTGLGGTGFGVRTLIRWIEEL